VQQPSLPPVTPHPEKEYNCDAGGTRTTRPCTPSGAADARLLHNPFQGVRALSNLSFRAERGARSVDLSRAESRESRPC